MKLTSKRRPQAALVERQRSGRWKVLAVVAGLAGGGFGEPVVGHQHVAGIDMRCVETVLAQQPRHHLTGDSLAVRHHGIGQLGTRRLIGRLQLAQLAWLVALGAVNSVISAYFYLRVIRVMYLAEPKGDERPPRVISLELSVAVTAVAVIALGVWPKGLLEIADRAVQQIF